MRSHSSITRAAVAAAVALTTLVLSPSQAATTGSATGKPARPTRAATVRLSAIADRLSSNPGNALPKAGLPAAPGLGAKGAGAVAAGSLDSPDPTASFVAVEDDDSVAPPDTTGAAGPDHILAVTNARLRVQTKAGVAVESVPFAAFWEPLGVTDPFGPRLVYEPYGARWVLVARAGKQSATSAMLLAVSQTSDPSGLWNLYTFDADENNQTWADHPVVGFDRDRIVVQANMVRNDSNTAFTGAKIWAIPKTPVYSGALPTANLFTKPASFGNSQMPAVTYDAGLAVTYLLSDWSGPDGTLRLYSLQGPVGAETLTSDASVVVADPWADGPPGGNDFAPQAVTTRKIHSGGARIANLVYRNGSLWAAHTVFLPAGAPTRSAIQWWEIRPNATVVQRGLVDDGPGARHFAFGSIAVNANGDALVGFSRFSSTSFAGAGYAFRYGTDTLSTLRNDRLLKAGEAKYDRGVPKNLWGSSSATVVDPSNDRALWTLQEFAWTPNVLHDRWSTWWGEVVSTAVPAATVTPASLGFGNQNVGTRSTEHTVTVTNSGTANLVVQSLTVTGENAADFAAGTDGCTNVPVAPGASCAIGMAFTPATPGPRAATLQVATNAGGEPARVAMSGTGTMPSGAVLFTPASIDFGAVDVGTTASPRQITVTNNGTAPLIISAVIRTGGAASEYAIVSDACSAQTLPAGTSCVVSLTFTPAGAGSRGAFLQVASNAPGGPHTAPLTGSGIVSAPELTRSPATLSFPDQTVGTTSAPQQTTVFNTGTAPLVIGIIAIAGNNAAEFIKTGDMCSNATIAPGFSCAVAVAFAPAGGGGRYAGMAIPSNTLNSPHMVSLLGVGSGGPAPRIELSPASVGFGDVGVGTTSPSQAVTLTNTGSIALVVGQLGLWGTYANDYAKTADGCSNHSVAPGGSCTVHVVFAPTGLGLRSGALSIPSNAGGSPLSVTLSGTGADRIAPTTSIQTKEGAVLLGLPTVVLPSVQAVLGRTVDDLSGVSRVVVTFTPAAGDETVVVVSLVCGATNRGCSWNAPVPVIPGTYDVSVEATDYAGNVETNGPGISIIVL